MALSFIVAGICSWIAYKKKRNPLGWFLGGLLFSFLALIVLAFLPPLDPPRSYGSASGQFYKKTSQASNAYKASSASQQDVEISVHGLSEERFEGSSIEINNFNWYYLDPQHRSKGPFSLFDLKSLWRNREVSQETFVWNDSMRDWMRIKNIPSLLEKLI